MKIPVLALLGLVAVALLLSHWGVAARPTRLPAIALTTLDGQRLDTARLRGHPVLITFWSVSCPPCLREIPQLTALHRDLAARGLIIVGIDMAYDPADHVLALVHGRRLPYPIALDPLGKAAAAFGSIAATPTTFLFDGEGRRVARFVGPMDTGQLRATIQTLLPAGRVQAAANPESAQRLPAHVMD